MLDRAPGGDIQDERLTVAQYLKDWLATVHPPIVRPRTYRYYEQVVRLYLLPALGRYHLTKLTAAQVQHRWANLLTLDLSPTTVWHAHNVLHKALDDALRLGLVHRNVTDSVQSPKQAEREMQVLTQEQVQSLAAAKDDPHYALFVLALSTGMRQGELLALRWQNLDLQRRTLHVRATLNIQEILKSALHDQPGAATGRDQNGTRDRERMLFAPPKTKGSRRQIQLSVLAVEALQAHRVRQYERRLAAGPT
jgi:integrase